MSCPLGRAVTERAEERGELRAVPGAGAAAESEGGGCCPAFFSPPAAVCGSRDVLPSHQGFPLPASFSCKDFCEEVSCGAFSSFQALLHVAELILIPSKDGRTF